MYKNRVVFPLLLLLASATPAQAAFFVANSSTSSPPPSNGSKELAEAWQAPSPKLSVPCKKKTQLVAAETKPQFVTAKSINDELDPYNKKWRDPKFSSMERVEKKITCYMYEGSLKGNLERLAAENGWNRVIWKLPVDFKWTGTAKLTGPNLPEVFQAVIDKYPVQATFYHANHIVALTPREYHD